MSGDAAMPGAGGQARRPVRPLSTYARSSRQSEARLYERSDAFREIYRWRAGIEATMSHLKHHMKLAKLRIRGMSSMRYVVNLRALGLNIRRSADFAP
jgi:hypothetical protein